MAELAMVPVAEVVAEKVHVQGVGREGGRVGSAVEVEEHLSFHYFEDWGLVPVLWAGVGLSAAAEAVVLSPSFGSRVGIPLMHHFAHRRDSSDSSDP